MWEKLRTAVTDVNRVRRTDPGDPGVCNIYTIHRAFSPNEALLEIDRGCRSASIGCIDCKKTLFSNMMAELDPIRDKAVSLNNNMDYVIDVIKTGADSCRAIAEKTMDEVRDTIGLFV
jgi:tryptophanyl-tRNA synthetase